MTRRILLRLKLLKHPYLASRSRRSTCGRYQSIGLTLRPPSEDELLERGDCGGGVVLGGPDVRAVEEPKPDLDRLLPAGHLPGPDRGSRPTNPHQLPPPPKIPPAVCRNNRRGRGRESAGEIRVREEKAAGNPRRKGKHRCGSRGGSDLPREDLEVLRGGQSEEETGVSRRKERRGEWDSSAVWQIHPP